MADGPTALAARALCEADAALAITLVVPPDVVADPTRLLGPDPGLRLVPATSALGAREGAAVRGRRLASVRVAAKEVRDGRAAAWIATGPPEPALAAAQFTLGLRQGLTAPIIAVPLQTRTGRLVLIASDSPPEDTAPDRIGALVARRLLGVDEPRVRRLATRWPAEPGTVTAGVLIRGHDGDGSDGDGHDGGGSIDAVVTDLATAWALLEVTSDTSPALVLGLEGLLVLQPIPGPPAVEEQVALAVRALRCGLDGHVSGALATLVAERRAAAGLAP